MLKVHLLLPLLLLALLLAGASLAGDQGIDPDAVPPAPAPVREAPAPKMFAHPEGLVSAAELAELLARHDPQLLVIDARAKELYEQGHIGGALQVDSDALQDPQTPPYDLASRETIRKLARELGIQPGSRVVIYDEDDGRLAARIWFTLYAYGHDHAAILDGGVAKWRESPAGGKAAPRPWTTDAARPKSEGAFEPAEKPRGVIGFDDLAQFRLRVQEFGELPATTLIDARTQAEYMGEDVRGKGGGHIPGAANIEWSALMMGKEGARVWRSPPEIHAILRVGGIDKARKIALYDQAGGRSSHLFFTLWLMGFEHIYNYTAGWREYGNKDGVEVEK